MLELNCFDVLKPCRRKATGSESEHKTPKCWKDLIFEHVFVKLKSIKCFFFRVGFLLKIRHTRDLINTWVFLNDGKTLGKSCWYLHEVKLWKIYLKTEVKYNICNAQLYFKFQIGKSNKLEKADILEMTVDFVKRSHPTTSKEGTHKMSSYLWENSFNSLTTAHNANIIFISFQKVKIVKV